MSASEPSWALFEAFVAVMTTGSLSAAARAMRVAQPTVRRQIEQLEEELGVVLFTRATNGLVPTELARTTMPYAESIAAGARAFVRALSAPASAERGTVRITCSDIVGAEVLPPMLVALHESHPDIQIELALTNRNEDLLRRDADIAIRMVEPTQQGLVRRRATRIELGLFATREYLERHTPPRRLADLSEHVLIGPDRERAVFEILGKLGLPSTPRHYLLRCDADLAKVAAVRAGLGVGICQVPLSRTPVALVRVLPSFLVHLDAWVTMHEDLRDVRRIRVVFDHLVTALERYGADASPARRRSVRLDRSS
ncbi:MAG TPA: LysR family transcriptional regulator [Nannocystaceae bacterium]|nr:LysR family transcriptional regulator [Nannocystaceae bacterium]